MLKEKISKENSTLKNALKKKDKNRIEETLEKILL